MLVGIWQGFCLHQDLSKPAGSAETPKEALDFQQAPWHFPGSAASRTLAVDLQLDTCFTSALSPCQREGAKHDARLQAGAGSWFLGYLLLCAVSIFGSSFQILQRSDVCYYLSCPFWFLPPSFLSLGRLENGRKLKCILIGRSLGLNRYFAFLATCRTLIVSCFLVLRAKCFYLCLRI